MTMDEYRQQQIRTLAQQQMNGSSNSDEQALAMGTLELLDYVDVLVNELEITTEKCCEAMYVVYENALSS